MVVDLLPVAGDQKLVRHHLLRVAGVRELLEQGLVGVARPRVLIVEEVGLSQQEQHVFFDGEIDRLAAKPCRAR